MSWTIGGMIIKMNFSGDCHKPLALIGRHGEFTGRMINFEGALALDNNRTAVGTVSNSTIIINEFLPYDCSFTTGKKSVFDHKLEYITAKEKITITVFIMDGISGTYGYSIFEDGKRVRRWAAMSEEILCNEGAEQAFEKDYTTILTGQAEQSGDEQKLINMIEFFLDQSFISLLEDDSPSYCVMK